MICTDCNGSGKYQPLFGPAENCGKCGGTGQQAGATGGFVPTGKSKIPGAYISTNAGSFDPNIVRVHLIQPSSPFAADVGDWRFFDAAKPGKTIDTLDEFEGEFVSMRMLACDFRNRTNVINVVYDDDPAKYNQMRDEADRLKAGAGMAVGPDIEIKVGLMTAWWHAYSKTNMNKVVTPTPCSPNGLFHPGYIGSRYRFKSVQVNAKMGSWWAPSIERL